MNRLSNTDIPENILPCPYCRIIVKKLEPNRVYTQNQIAELVKDDMTRKTALLHINDLITLGFLENHAIHKRPKQLVLNTFNIAVKIQQNDTEIKRLKKLPAMPDKYLKTLTELATSMSHDLNEDLSVVYAKLLHIEPSTLISILHSIEEKKNTLEASEINRQDYSKS